VAYENNNDAGWLSLVIIVSSIATIYQLYWDFVKDWGLLQFNSKNTWLRNDLILKQKYIYFLSMVCSRISKIVLMTFKVKIIISLTENQILYRV
jgi:hypothetical protein